MESTGESNPSSSSSSFSICRSGHKPRRSDSSGIQNRRTKSSRTKFPEPRASSSNLSNPSKVHSALGGATVNGQVVISGDDPRITLLSSSAPTQDLHEIMVEEKISRAYFDEDEIFNMPGLIFSLAEALMIAPPAMDCGLSQDDARVDIEDLTLWSDSTFV